MAIVVKIGLGQWLLGILGSNGCIARQILVVIVVKIGLGQWLLGIFSGSSYKTRARAVS